MIIEIIFIYFHYQYRKINTQDTTRQDNTMQCTVNNNITTNLKNEWKIRKRKRDLHDCFSNLTTLNKDL